MQEIEVKILKWEKYQLRKDIKSPWWFATNNELWRSPEFSIFTPEEKVVWYALLAIASKEQKATVKFDLAWFAQNSGVEKDFVLSAIEKASNNKWLTIIRTESVRDPYAIRTAHNITRHNKTEHNNTKQDKYKNNLLTVSPELSSSIAGPTEEELIKNNFSEFLNQKIETLYPDSDFVSREKEKMKVWLAANPKKQPKSKSGWTRFVMGWLERGWENYRKTIQSQAPKKKTWQDLVDEEEARNGQKSV
jgi:hypothetical protein